MVQPFDGTQRAARGTGHSPYWHRWRMSLVRAAQKPGLEDRRMSTSDPSAHASSTPERDALVASYRVPPISLDRQSPRVAVVGAGLAGLNSAFS